MVHDAISFVSRSIAYSHLDDWKHSVLQYKDLDSFALCSKVPLLKPYCRYHFENHHTISGLLFSQQHSSMAFYLFDIMIFWLVFLLQSENDCSLICYFGSFLNGIVACGHFFFSWEVLFINTKMSQMALQFIANYLLIGRLCGYNIQSHYKKSINVFD